MPTLTPSWEVFKHFAVLCKGFGAGYMVSVWWRGVNAVFRALQHDGGSRSGWTYELWIIVLGVERWV